jgi:hypothetical protein
MTKDEKLGFISKLFMYGAKVGYEADIVEVEYFIRSAAADMGVNLGALATSTYVNTDGELAASAEETEADILRKLAVLNP